MDRDVVPATLTTSSRLDVRLLDSVRDLRLASELLASVWRVPVLESPGPVNILRALADTGGYVAGAWDEQTLVGAAFGLLYGEDGRLELRSQVTGTTRPGMGIGSALKWHQREWAAQRGLAAITWTFDPFVHRNAAFNLSHLGARLVRFVDNFYGPLHDGVNGDEETDRVVVRWDVRAGAPVSSRPSGVADAVPHDDLVAAVRIGVDGDPIVRPVRGGPVSVEVPASFTSAEQRRRWRVAVRDGISSALDAGLEGTSFGDGRYVFRRPTD